MMADDNTSVAETPKVLRTVAKLRSFLKNHGGGLTGLEEELVES